MQVFSIYVFRKIENFFNALAFSLYTQKGACFSKYILEKIKVLKEGTSFLIYILRKLKIFFKVLDFYFVYII